MFNKTNISTRLINSGSMTLIIMWYQRVYNCRQYCFDHVSYGTYLVALVLHYGAVVVVVRYLSFIENETIVSFVPDKQCKASANNCCITPLEI